MDTKLKADIAESAVVTKLLERGFRVLRPVGDRLSYDLGVDLDGKFIRIQVKSAWFNKKGSCYTVDVRRTKTNRRHMLRQRYDANDFDFAIIYIADLNVFYVMPVSAFSRYGSSVTFVESDKRQRKPKSANYREQWDLLFNGSLRRQRLMENLSNSVEPSTLDQGNTEPSLPMAIGGKV
ncbi:MAG: endonuclease [Candidatus Omnitrophota bacterium]|nr:MAG: endonuclease [Candidatus Omnitrophota bacterium]